jgi:hypothetical protein
VYAFRTLVLSDSAQAFFTLAYANTLYAVLLGRLKPVGLRSAESMKGKIKNMARILSVIPH